MIWSWQKHNLPLQPLDVKRPYARSFYFIYFCGCNKEVLKINIYTMIFKAGGNTKIEFNGGRHYNNNNIKRKWRKVTFACKKNQLVVKAFFSALKALYLWKVLIEWTEDDKTIFQRGEKSLRPPSHSLLHTKKTSLGVNPIKNLVLKDTISFQLLDGALTR